MPQARSMFPWKKIFSCFLKCAQSAMDYLQSLSHSLILSRFFSSVCPPCWSNLFSESLRTERAPTSKNELTASVFQYEIFMHIPNCLKSIHNVGFFFKKKKSSEKNTASSKKKCFWGNHSLVADICKKPGAKLFSVFPELSSVPTLSRWHMSYSDHISWLNSWGFFCLSVFLGWLANFKGQKYFCILAIWFS